MSISFNVIILLLRVNLTTILPNISLIGIKIDTQPTSPLQNMYQKIQRSLLNPIYSNYSNVFFRTTFVSTW